MRIGIVKPGSTYGDMIARFGDYDAWFAEALAPSGADLDVYAWSDGDEPAPDQADGWIVTGARSSVLDDDPSVERLLEWIRQTVPNRPLLGVCYGHQALCQAMGGEVARHPDGWELGTVEIALTEAGKVDPLFAGLPDRFPVQTTHMDYVKTLPPAAVPLATNPHTEHQAIALGPIARGVQFHPEVTEEISADFVGRRRHLVREAEVGPTPLARTILTNWAATIG